MNQSISEHRINVDNACATNLSTQAKHLKQSIAVRPRLLWALMIYCFCLGSAVKAVFSSTLCFLLLHRGPNREGEDPAECRVLQKDPQPCQRGGQSDGEPIGEKHTIHHSTHCYVVIEHQLESGKFILRPLKVSACLTPSLSVLSGLCLAT